VEAVTWPIGQVAISTRALTLTPDRWHSPSPCALISLTSDQKLIRIVQFAKFILACAYLLGYKRWDNRNKEGPAPCFFGKPTKGTSKE
jgi:hypothetical protein